MEKTEQLTNEYIAKELSRLREIRARLENEYEYMAFSCRHGIGDVEANKAEAHRLGRILGRRAVIIERELSDDTKRKNNDTKCKNPKNQDVLNKFEMILSDIKNANEEIRGVTLNFSFGNKGRMFIKGEPPCTLPLLAALIYSLSGNDINKAKKVLTILKTGIVAGSDILEEMLGDSNGKN